MAYAFITEIKNVRKHSNADKLNVGECFGNQVIVSLETQDGQVGVYFATDSQLGEKYATVNDLLRRKDENGNQAGGYLEPEKRNIRALKLRGEMSDGLFMPLESLSKFTDINKLKQGDCVDILDGVIIAQKYYPRRNSSNSKSNELKSKKDKFKEVEFPLFEEHIDTSQYAYNKHAFRVGDLVTITLKMHGTSGRTGYLTKRQYAKPTKLNNILIKAKLKKPYSESYDTVTGTRRVVLDTFSGGYYGNDGFRKKYHDELTGKLRKGESIYYEIVGYTEGDNPIMPRCQNSKMNDKEFIKTYGATTTFSYGCEVGENKIYVYRMNMTNEDGEVVEYPTWLIQKRCEEMGLNFVPVLSQFIIDENTNLDEIVNELCDGVDPVGLNHIREGAVLRIENRVKFTAYKHKNFAFKLLEGIIKDTGTSDMEEDESLK